MDNSNDALQVVGFVCATLTTAASLTHESMGAHEPEGTMLCIHSVVVAEHRRRKKIGSRLLTAYVNYVSMARPDVESMRLLCKEYLVRVVIFCFHWNGKRFLIFSFFVE